MRYKVETTTLGDMFTGRPREKIVARAEDDCAGFLRRLGWVNFRPVVLPPAFLWSPPNARSLSPTGFLAGVERDGGRHGIEQAHAGVFAIPQATRFRQERHEHVEPVGDGLSDLVAGGLEESAAGIAGTRQVSGESSADVGAGDGVNRDTLFRRWR